MARILIVDNQPLVGELLAHALEHAGHQTVSMQSRMDALRTICASTFDLIILDIALPAPDGLLLLKSIRSEQGANVCVIILTSLTDKPTVLAAAKLGIQGFVPKSKFSLVEFMGLIEKTLKSKPIEQPAPDTHQAPSSPSTTTAPHSPITGPPAAKRDQIGDLRDLKPLITRANLLARLDDCGELQGFSPAIAEVLKLTSNDRCSIEQVAKAISRDHGMALKILKLANSAVYTRGEPVDAVQKAVLRIGLGQIRQAVLNLAVIDQYRTTCHDERVHGGQFWEHAIATGIIAAEIARVRDEKAADGAFTMGLLHDVGRMVLMHQLGDLYKEVLRVASEWQLPLEQVEHRMLCFNHAEAMDKVFRKWNFPREFINPIVHHHLSAPSIREAVPQEVATVATLALANRLVHALMLGSSGNQTIYSTDDLCEMLRLDPSAIVRIEQMARDETDKMKFALLVHSNQSNWVPMRDIHRKSLTVPMRPIYVSSSPVIDAHRIFVDQLTDDQQFSQPNIGVIYFRSLREKVVLSEQFRKAEAEAGVHGLPLIVISPTGKIMPEHSLVESRALECLTAPFVISRFIDSVNALCRAPTTVAAAA